MNSTTIPAPTPPAPAAGSGRRRRGKRMRLARVRNPWTAGLRPPYTLTELEFVAWLRELTEDRKWKAPTAWDEHTFRVGVQMELRRVNAHQHQPARSVRSPYWPLFKHMADNHGLTLVDSEMQDICHVVETISKSPNPNQSGGGQ